MSGGLGKSDGGGLADAIAQGATQEIGGSSAGSEKTLAEGLAELDALVGLTEVKAQVRKLLATQQANEVRRQANLPQIPMSLHLVFTGDAGTGKTTVARIVGSLYRSAQLLPTGSLVETDRSGLVAGYVGQTAIKVTEMLNQADGGVLYIDEAYSLFSGGSSDFGEEAVATLVKGMEDRRNSLAVIVSGYEDEMQRFIDSNPGLRSRFQTFIHFPNYTAQELLEIFQGLAASYSIDVSPDVSAKLLHHFTTINAGGHRGNARYVRGLFESMYAQMALAAAEDGVVETHELAQFTLAHLPAVEGDRVHTFGFGTGS